MVITSWSNPYHVVLHIFWVNVIAYVFLSGISSLHSLGGSHWILISLRILISLTSIFLVRVDTWPNLTYTLLGFGSLRHGLVFITSWTETWFKLKSGPAKFGIMHAKIKKAILQKNERNEGARNRNKRLCQFRETERNFGVFMIHFLDSFPFVDGPWVPWNKFVFANHLSFCWKKLRQFMIYMAF